MAWVIDSAHTRANFSVRHLMISNVRGQFDKISGTVDFNDADPAKSHVEVKIDASSIDTKDEKRDGHLKSPDFLDVAKFPFIEFKSKRVQKVDNNSAKLFGDLTIRGTTKEVALDVDYNGQGKTPWGTTNAGFSATTKINRKDWDLNWNVALETGGFLVGDDIKIEIEAEIVKQ
jgi:polyisoprenoid-binding protein YceI